MGRQRCQLHSLLPPPPPCTPVTGLAAFPYSPTWFMYEVIRPEDEPGMHRCTTEIPILMKRHTFCHAFYAYSRNFETVWVGSSRGLSRAGKMERGGGACCSAAPRCRDPRVLNRVFALSRGVAHTPALAHALVLAVFVLVAGAQPEAG